ncbi:jg12518 [Pararge aegeria aegeria]|uniref:Jg12518 protein n=1 Tax=Pararge aegeria aegeria TaxID=348720 RepID=A0A8S4R724_9NEOP|nr:jg12518 [Pararge aegeria aegeria]
MSSSFLEKESQWVTLGAQWTGGTVATAAATRRYRSQRGVLVAGNSARHASVVDTLRPTASASIIHHATTATATVTTRPDKERALRHLPAHRRPAAPSPPIKPEAKAKTKHN